MPARTMKTGALMVVESPAGSLAFEVDEQGEIQILVWSKGTDEPSLMRFPIKGENLFTVLAASMWQGDEPDIG